MPSVSVVIPTYRRPRLVERAVTSVLAQSYKSFEVLVVIDGVDDGTRAVIEALNDNRTRVIETGINQGPAAARNFGVGHAVGRYITILDDDDEWTDDKLERQMQFVSRHGLEGRDFLLSCRTIGRNLANGKSYVWPANLYQEGEDLSEYLLDRRTPFNRPGYVGSGTLFFPRTLALRVPFPDDEVHEDWSWLLICVGRERVPLMMCEDPLFIYNMNPIPSRNNMMNWRKSLEWGRSYRGYISDRAFAGLLSSTTAWRAKRQDGPAAFVEIARAMWNEGRASAMHWLMLGAVMMFPLTVSERLRQRSFSNESRRRN
jgi:glycosyltransferase involved in cell wall biosynthesis